MEEGRRERKKRQTREAIAETAVRLFAERGYDDVTIADVAAAADVAVTTVFNHFKTKEDLFFGAFTPPDDGLAARLRARAPGVGPAEVVHALLADTFDRPPAPAEVEAKAAHHDRFRAVLMASPALQLGAMHRFRARRFEGLDEIAAAITAPEPPDFFAGIVAGQLLALVESTYFEAERRRRAGEPPEAIAACTRDAYGRACEALARGLAGYGRR